MVLLFQPMFEIKRDDIAALYDEDLRMLIGLLCEAELRRVNLPVSAVTWGGNDRQGWWPRCAGIAGGGNHGHGFGSES